MLIILFVLIVLFILIFFISQKKYFGDFKDFNKKDHPLHLFYPLAIYTRNILKRIPGVTHEQLQIKRFQKLYPKGNAKEKYYNFILKRDSIVLLTIIVLLILAAISEISNYHKTGYLQGNKLIRPESGIGEDISLLIYSDEIQGEEFRLKLRSRRLYGNELNEYFEQVRKELEKIVLAGNESFDNIYLSLNFIDEVPNSNLTVKWSPEDTNLISINGKVNNEELSPEGVETYIYITLTYYEEESIEFLIPMHIYPPILTDQEILKNEIKKAYENAEKETLFEDHVILPDNVLDKTILWEEQKESNLNLFLIYGIAIIVLILFTMSNELRKKEKFRERQMYLDYSNIVSKFTLLLAAGMTIRGAWECIAIDYEKKVKTQKGKQQLHFAYEEMLTTLHEIKIGISESKAYENYGKRCMLIPYIKFTTIIVQNLKKGTIGILPLLEMEEKNAFSERKEISRRLGEEAGTKLQAPLMIYLIIVLIIVLVPAFLSL